MSEEQQWYYMNGEEQLGPVSPEGLQELAATGQLLPDSPVWTEGLEEWAQASQVEGLFPDPAAVAPSPPQAQAHPHLIVGAEAQAAHPLAGEILTPQAGAPAAQQAAVPQAVPQPQVAGAYVPQVAGVPSPQIAGGYAPPAGMAGAPMAPGQPGQIVAPGENYPPPGPMKASFAWFVLLPILALLGFGAAIGLIYARATSVADEAAAGGTTSVDLYQFMFEMMGVLVGATAFYALCFLVFIILKCLVLYKAWSAIKFAGPRTTAGKAVGFLFIPFFKFYWIFVAYLGLAKDWNRVRASHPNLLGSPGMSEGFTMTFCIITLVYKVFWWAVFLTNLGQDEPGSGLSLIIAGMGLVALIFEIIFLSGVCRMVNFMGRLHLPQAQPRPGGLQFY